MSSTPPRLQSSREDLTRQLVELFRIYGFEGVSIGDVSTKTGLGRSSLYHYFPGGKQEMAQSVLDTLRVALNQAIFVPLAGTGPLETRIDAMLLAVDQIYEGGRLPCVLASLLATPNSGPIASGAANLMADWTLILSNALKTDGVSKSHERACHAMSLIQGALITARALDDQSVFLAALKQARHVLLDPV